MYEIDNYIHDKIAAVYKSGMSEVDKILLEYMEKKGLTIDDLQGNVEKREEEIYEPYKHRIAYWYQGDFIFSITDKFDATQPLAITVTVIVKKGDW